MSDQERIREIKDREEKAACGPWEFKRTGVGYQIIAPDSAVLLGDGDATADDMRFVAHSRDDIPWLLARIRELEAENANLKADPAEVQKYWNRLTRIEITTPVPTPEPREG